MEIMFTPFSLVIGFNIHDNVDYQYIYMKHNIINFKFSSVQSLRLSLPRALNTLMHTNYDVVNDNLSEPY